MMMDGVFKRGEGRGGLTQQSSVDEDAIVLPTGLWRKKLRHTFSEASQEHVSISTVATLPSVSGAQSCSISSLSLFIPGLFPHRVVSLR